MTFSGADDPLVADRPDRADATTNTPDGQPDGQAAGTAAGTAVASAEAPAEADTADTADITTDAAQTADTGPAGAGAIAGARRTALTIAAVTAAVAVPMVVALISLRSPRWYPGVDLAQIEFRIRDVGTRNPPLVGLGGRIFGLGTQGSHPGPISFYLLAPVYRLLGATSWALTASAVALNLGAIAGTVWVGHRRWGLRGALAAGAALALVMRMYGTAPLVIPWNPFTPVLFWALFLACVWAVLCGDVVMLPIAVIAGSICAQTHLPYVGLVGGLGVVTLVALGLAYHRAAGDAPARARIARWTLGSAALAVVAWVPVFVDELGGDPGNLGIIIDSFRHPRDPELGLEAAWRSVREHVDVVQLLQGNRLQAGSTTTGTLTILAWAASAALAWRIGARALVRLHAVVGAALVLGLLSISRILGYPWPHLTLWTYGLAGLMVVTAVTTVVLALAGRPRVRAIGRAGLHRVGLAGVLGPGGKRAERLGVAALVVAIAVPTALLPRPSPDAEDDASVSRFISPLVAPTLAAIEGGEVGTGPDGTFLVTWTDPVTLGTPGFGLMIELERRGYEVRAPEPMRLAVRGHRIAEEAQVDAVIYVASGVGAVDTARERPGARELAYHDPRTAAQADRYDRLRAAVIDGLEQAGLDDLVPQVDRDLIALGGHTRLPPELRPSIDAMWQMPQPVGVYTWDPGR